MQICMAATRKTVPHIRAQLRPSGLRILVSPIRIKRKNIVSGIAEFRCDDGSKACASVDWLVEGKREEACFIRIVHDKQRFVVRLSGAIRRFRCVHNNLAVDEWIAVEGGCGMD